MFNIQSELEQSSREMEAPYDMCTATELNNLSRIQILTVDTYSVEHHNAANRRAQSSLKRRPVDSWVGCNFTHERDS